MKEPDHPARLDRAALADLREATGGDAAFFAELVDTFLAESPALVAQMLAAIAARDAVTLRRAAHTLKSSSRTFGASGLGDICQAIEERAATDNLGDIPPLLGTVQAEYPAVAAALQLERARH